MFRETNYSASGFEQDAEARTQNPIVKYAATAYTEGLNTSFFVGEDKDSIQDRLCSDCPAREYCGAAVNSLVQNYKPDGMIPKKDQATSASRGIQTSTDSYEVCPQDPIKSAVTAVRLELFTIDKADPLNSSTQGHQAVETVRHAVDNTVKTLRNGIRL